MSKNNMDDKVNIQIESIVQALCEAEQPATTRKPVLEEYSKERVSEIILKGNFLRFCRAASRDNANYWEDVLSSIDIYNKEGLLLLIENICIFERQLTNIFRKHEGSELCYDKTSVVISKLKRHLISGEKIELDVKSVSSWGYPKTTLNNHESILMFFDSLSSLIYGDTEKYLSFLSNLDSRLDYRTG
ncbi:hypothetical protein [Vibrio parahaemolyticus]|nr:hypothetical protein [Vibrio parahaemolyticus]